MCAKKLGHYTGRLDASQVAAGMNAAARNGHRLAADASLLLENKRFPSAVALAILSIEESGKLSILRRLATSDSVDQIKQCWREYRSHTKKNVLGAFLDHFAKGARRLDQFATLFEPDAEHPVLLDHVKQIAFYSDCLGEAHWSEPENVIDEALARNVVLTATILVQDKEVTPLEIQLWVEHVGPHLHGSRAKADEALQSWYAAMQRHGLKEPGENSMTQFVQTGIGVSESAKNAVAQ